MKRVIPKMEAVAATKARQYHNLLQKHAALKFTAHPKSFSNAKTSNMSLDEASEYFDRISAELPGYAQVLRDIKSEYDQKVMSKLTQAGNESVDQSISDVNNSYGTILKEARAVKDLEERILQMVTENEHLKNEICEEEEELRKMQSSSSETDSTESLSKASLGRSEDKYIARVHELQLEIVSVQEATRLLQEETSERALLVECEQLEQYWKESQLHNSKLARKAEELNSTIQICKAKLDTLFDHH